MSETQVTERTSLASRVRAGVALLDREEPGWWSKVDVASLKLDDCWMCVLGQAFGSYHNGVQRLPIEKTGRASSSHGFTFTIEEDCRFTDWGTLNRLWAYVVRTRQAVAQ